jgi:DNA mismatch repair protein MutS
MRKTSSEKLTPLMRQYYNIKSKYPGVILFFRLGDFYEMFGEDAVQAAPLLDVVLTNKAGTPMCGVPYHSVSSYIRKLITTGLKVAVCEQLEEPSVSKGIVKRGVTKVITPGTILEDTLLESKENNFIMSIAFDDSTMSVALAAADISTGEFFASETSLKLLDTEISKYRPGELVISSSNAKNKWIQDFAASIKVPISYVNDCFF